MSVCIHLTWNIPCHVVTFVRGFFFFFAELQRNSWVAALWCVVSCKNATLLWSSSGTLAALSLPARIRIRSRAPLETNRPTSALQSFGRLLLWRSVPLMYSVIGVRARVTAVWPHGRALMWFSNSHWLSGFSCDCNQKVTTLGGCVTTWRWPWFID